MASNDQLENIKNQLEELLLKEKRNHFLRKIAYTASCLVVLVSLVVTHNKLMQAINPRDMLEVARFKMTQGIPVANQEMKKMIPGLVDQVVVSFVEQTPEILKEKIIGTTKPLVNDLVKNLGQSLAEQMTVLAQNKDMISPNKADASAAYAAAFSQLGDSVDHQLVAFYQESRPVLRQMISDVKVLRDETNLSPREELIKKIIGLTLSMIEKEKMASR